MTLDELETGLRRLNQMRGGDFTFWDENIATFRLTVLVAMRETSEMLALSNLPLKSWTELERQSVLLRHYLSLADKYLRLRRLAPHQNLPVFG